MEFTKQEVRKLWVGALRSEEYKQGMLSLHTYSTIPGVPDHFCCLSVLCDLAVKNNVIPSAKKQSEGNYYSYEGAIISVPSKVMEWAGLFDKEGKRFGDNEFCDSSLTHLNDSTPLTFFGIADILETDDAYFVKE
jgi:hypothetical protein